MKKFLLSLFAFVSAFALNAMATVPVEISGAITDLEDTWDLIKPVIIAVGIFSVLWAFFRRKAGKVR